MGSPTIPAAEYARRRKRVLSSLKSATAVVFAGEPTGDQFRVDPHFAYLTGIRDEPRAALMFDPGQPVPARRVQLFLKSRDPEIEQWDGIRPAIDAALRARIGIETIFRLGAFPRLLADAVRRSKRVSCLHPFAVHTQAMSSDLAIYRKVAERIPGTVIEDGTDLLVAMRGRKSAAEVRMLKHAVDITSHGYDAVLAGLEPGMNEFDVQEMLEHHYKLHGSRGTEYDSIVGGGLMGTVLHYRANEKALVDGELVVIDSAASYCGYTADVTRTFPIGGRFTTRQREIYEIVLRAEEAAIRAVKPGVKLAQLDAVARKIIEKAGFGDYFIHSIGHHLGLEVHDVTPTGALKEGAVITIEPGIYLPDEKLGVRIEDDIVVTKDGYKNLSAAIPKKVAAIEKAMAAR